MEKSEGPTTERLQDFTPHEERVLLRLGQRSMGLSDIGGEKSNPLHVGFQDAREAVGSLERRGFVQARSFLGIEEFDLTPAGQKLVEEMTREEAE